MHNTSIRQLYLFTWRARFKRDFFFLSLHLSAYNFFFTFKAWRNSSFVRLSTNKSRCSRRDINFHLLFSCFVLRQQKKTNENISHLRRTSRRYCLHRRRLLFPATFFPLQSPIKLRVWLMKPRAACARIWLEASLIGIFFIPAIST